MMDVVFKDDDLDRLEIDPTFDADFPLNIVKAFRKRMQQIRSFKDERDFYNLRSLRFEKLKGTRRHQHSIRLNDQWRLILEFEGSGNNKKCIIVEINDYHK